MDESARSSNDLAGDGEGKQRNGDKRKPEYGILWSSDPIANKENTQKQKLQLNDSDNDSKHRRSLYLGSLCTGAKYWNKLSASIFPPGEAKRKWFAVRGDGNVEG